MQRSSRDPFVVSSVEMYTYMCTNEIRYVPVRQSRCMRRSHYICTRTPNPTIFHRTKIISLHTAQKSEIYTLQLSEREIRVNYNSNNNKLKDTNIHHTNELRRFLFLFLPERKLQLQLELQLKKSERFPHSILSFF